MPESLEVKPAEGCCQGTYLQVAFACFCGRGLALPRVTAAFQEQLHEEGVMRMTVGLLQTERLKVLCVYVSLGGVWVFPHPAQAEDPFCRHARKGILLPAGRILPLPRLSLATLHKSAP